MSCKRNKCLDIAVINKFLKLNRRFLILFLAYVDVLKGFYIRNNYICNVNVSFNDGI